MNRRSFLAGLASLIVVAPATALATVQRLGTPAQWIEQPALATSTDFSAILNGYYRNLSADLVPVMVPLFEQFRALEAKPRSLFQAPKPRARVTYWTLPIA